MLLVVVVLQQERSQQIQVDRAVAQLATQDLQQAVLETLVDIRRLKVMPVETELRVVIGKAEVEAERPQLELLLIHQPAELVRHLL
jgi:hypothetical protein